MRILALPYGSSVAHTSRLLEIAKVLRERNHEIIFAGTGNCLKIASNAGFKVEELADVSLERVVEALRTTNFAQLYGDVDEMLDYIDKELKLYEKLKPDLILADDRRTSSTSAEIANLPHASVVNAHVTNYSAFPLLLPFYKSRNNVSTNPLFQQMYNLQVKIERLVYNSTLTGINKARQKLGLKKLYAYQITEGKDLTLIPDVDEFTPLKNPLSNFHYVGPITWESDLPPTPALPQFKTAKKRAYFTLGSGGFEEFVGYLKIFENSDFSILITAGELLNKVENSTIPQNVFIEKYVNADLLLPYCDVIVCHGGNGTIYQALKYGVPVISIPSHNEQDYNARRVEQLGLGKRLSYQAVVKDFSRVQKTMEEVTSVPSYKEKAKQFQKLLQSWNGPVQAANLIEKYFSQ